MRLAFTPSGHSYPGPGLSGMGVSGLGLDLQTQQIAATAAQGAATTGAILTGLAHMGVISAAFGPAAPIAAAVAGLVAVGLAIANQFQGCGQTCIAATQIANKVAIYWQQNLDTYMNAPVHFKSMQVAALNNFDFGWAAMVKACSDPALGDAGVRCISERQRGGASAWCCNSPTAVHVSDGMCTGCDAFADFRDPIANDPHVVPDPPEAVAAANALGVNIGGTSFPLPVLLAAGGLLLFTIMSDN
jgi:hypothetical protein